MGQPRVELHDALAGVRATFEGRLYVAIVYTCVRYFTRRIGLAVYAATVSSLVSRVMPSTVA